MEDIVSYRTLEKEFYANSSSDRYTAHDALRRLESMIMRAGTEAPLEMIKGDIANTIHMIIQAERGIDGKRRITEILEVNGIENGVYLANEVFKINAQHELLSTGYIPEFSKNNPHVKFTPDFFLPDKKIKLAS